MAGWDQDIHRIQEIQQLLENRQRYFCGQLNTSCYKVDNKGNPLYFPKLNQSTNVAVREPSFDHSVEVNFGSSEGNGAEYEASHHGESEGGGADADASEVSDSSDSLLSEQRQKQNAPRTKKHTKTKKMTKKKVNAGKLRGWVEKNIEQVSSCESRKSSVDRTKKTPTQGSKRKSSVSFRKKSVAFDDAWGLQQPIRLKEDEEISLPSRHRHKKKSDPIDLLKKRSWLVRPEEDSTFADERGIDIITQNQRKGSLKAGRETRKDYLPLFGEARATKRLSVAKGVPVGQQYLHKKQPIIPNANSFKQQAASRLVSRHAEEALKSDLNLREAFALIKINPDPIIQLASSKSKEKLHNPTLSKTKSMHPYDADESLATEDDTGDDPAIRDSLKRLTKLSLQHRQRQKSFTNGMIPSSSQNNQRKLSSSSFVRRRSSTISQTGNFQRRMSKDIRSSGAKQKFGRKFAPMIIAKRR